MQLLKQLLYTETIINSVDKKFWILQENIVKSVRTV